MGCCGDSSDVEPAKINGHVLSAAPQGEDFQGPVNSSSRVCRDVIFLILFLAFCIAGSLYLIVCASRGDIDRIIRGYDHYGNICGETNIQYLNSTKSGQDKTSYPYMQVNAIYPYNQCVASCNGSTSMLIGYTCVNTYVIDSSNTTWYGSVTKYFQSLPTTLNHLAGHIAAVCITGLVLAFIFALLLRFLAGIIVWITVAIIALGSIAVTIFAWVYWNEQRSVSSDGSRNTGLLVAAIVATVFTALTLILLIAMRSRIKLVIVLFSEGGKVIASLPLLLLQPFWTLLCLIVVVAVWAGGFVLIRSSGTPYITGPDGGINFKLDKIIEGLQWYHIFGFFWVSQFVLACQDVVIAGAVAAWYFTRNKSQLGTPIISSTSRLIRFHLGSVALGSLIIAIVKMIRFLLKYAEKYANGNNYLKWCLRCFQCLLYCLEKFLKFLTRNAYIEIAIYGYGFCQAAKKAFGVITNNALRISAINFVGDFVLFLVTISVVALNGFIGWLILKAGYNGPDEKELIIPLLITILFTYLIAYCFVSVYEMTIDTLFLCFCEDCEKNDGLEKPYFMSKGLMQFVENSHKALEALEYRNMASKNGVQPIQTVMPPYQYPYSPAVTAPPSTYPSPLRTTSGNLMRTGMTPLHPGYPPVSMPPTPSKFLPPPS